MKYWLKLVQSSDNKCIKKVYELLRSDSEAQPNCIKWCSLVRDLISTLGFYELWLYVCNVKLFLLNVNQRIETTLFRDGMVDYRIQAGPTFIKTLPILVSNHI